MSPTTEQPGTIPEDENQEPEITITRRVREVNSYSGPVPPAEEFARYEEINPGSAGRLISMAEREQQEIVSFRNKSLVATTIVTLTIIVAIAHILTLNPNVLVLGALAIAQALPSITDFLRGISENAMARKEQEFDLQIRKDHHELEMKAARKQLLLPSNSDEDSAELVRRLESSSESTDSLKGNR